MLCDAAFGAPFMVADINSQSDSHLSSNPRNFVSAGALVYFTAATGLGPVDIAQQLWRTDGTAAGTFAITDFPVRPGFTLDLESMTAVGNRLFFIIDTTQLWVTEGSIGSTRLLHTFEQEFNYSMIEYRGQLYFVARTSGTGRELWRSDGTPEGTSIVVDLVPGYSDGVLQWPMHVSANGLYFVSSDRNFGNTIGAELWITDGTADGTHLVADLWPGELGSYPSDFVEVGNKTLFKTHTMPILWATEGTAESTIALVEIEADSLVSAGDYAIFFPYDEARGREPWISDGTRDGTKFLTDFNPGPASSLNCFGTSCRGGRVAAAGGVVYFAATTAQDTDALALTDGSAGGTRVVGGGPLGLMSSVCDLVTAGDRVFFRARPSGIATSLWVSDGTPRGTIALPASPDESGERPCVASGNVLFFAGRDGRGSELWRSDGTVGGTAMVSDIRNPPSSSNPVALATLGPYLLFQADDGSSGSALWRSDGTAAGTRMVKDLDTSSEGFHMPLHGADSYEVFDGVFYFPAVDQQHGTELWRTDGTAEGTWLISDIGPGSESSYPNKFTAHDGALFFLAARGGAAGTSATIFRTDGTAEGTTPVFDLPQFVYEVGLASFGGYIYFAGAHLAGLWRTDGTPAGTELIPLDKVENIQSLTPFGDLLLFSGSALATGQELWASDGTVAGTFLVRDVNPSTERGRNSSSPSNFFRAGDELYFITRTGFLSNIMSLWRTDGTPDGTRHVVTPEDFFSSDIADLAVVGEGIAFSAFNFRRYGAELWMVDPAGRALVKDIVRGQEGSSPHSFVAVDETLLFSADDGMHGQELWRLQSFGDPALWYDLAPGRFGSNPSTPLLAGNYIYFTATHPEFGNELWAVSVAEVAGMGAMCVGDCDGDGAVTVDELTTGVNIALEILPQSRCRAIDPDGSGITSVDEIIAAVERALNGCP